MRLVPALLLGTLCAAPALAEDSPAEPIVVTGQPLEQSMASAAYPATVLTRDRMASSASGRLEDVLASVAGFQQFRRSDSRSSNPSAQGMTSRGLGGNATSRTLVLIDGVPLSDPFFGYVPFPALPFERLDRAVLTRGGGSLSAGAGAVAGTVELFSASADGLGPASGSLMVNDRGESEASASFAPRLGSGFAVVSGRWDRGQGFWMTPAGQRVPASVRAKFDSWSVSLRGVAPLAPEIELQARALLFDDRRTIRFAGADTTSSGGDASLRLVGRGEWEFELLGYVQARDFSNVVISSTSFRKTLDQHKTPSTGIGAKFELRPPLGEIHELRLGLDWRRASGEMQEDAYSAVTGQVTARRVAGGVNSDLGFYGEYAWTTGPALLTAGVRADRWSVAGGRFRETAANGTITSNLQFASRSGWQASLRGGALIDLSGGFKLRANGYTGMRQATLNELYRPFVVFPVTTRANAALANERLEGYEFGADFEPSSQLHLSLTAFDNRIKGAIANVTIGANLRERRNVDAVRSRGIEAAAAAKLGKLDFDATLTLLDPEVEASGLSAPLYGKRPAQTPRLAATATFAWRPSEDFLVSATVRHTGAQFEDDLQTDRLPAATTLDAVVRVPLVKGIGLLLRGENLTDSEIVTRNQAGSLDLGAPRTIWAGVTFKF
jgi:vitamin B12 transporter